MYHAFDKRLDVGSGNDRYWLRITADVQDDDGEPISKPYRCVAIEDEEMGSMIALSRAQAQSFIETLQQALKATA
jgi:hypothetical protein